MQVPGLLSEILQGVPAAGLSGNPLAVGALTGDPLAGASAGSLAGVQGSGFSALLEDYAVDPISPVKMPLGGKGAAATEGLVDGGLFTAPVNEAAAELPVDPALALFQLVPPPGVFPNAQAGLQVADVPDGGLPVGVVPEGEGEAGADGLLTGQGGPGAASGLAAGNDPADGVLPHAPQMSGRPVAADAQPGSAGAGSVAGQVVPVLQSASVAAGGVEVPVAAQSPVSSSPIAAPDGAPVTQVGPVQQVEVPRAVGADPHGGAGQQGVQAGAVGIGRKANDVVLSQENPLKESQGPASGLKSPALAAPVAQSGASEAGEGPVQVAVSTAAQVLPLSDDADVASTSQGQAIVESAAGGAASEKSSAPDERQAGVQGQGSAPSKPAELAGPAGAQATNGVSGLVEAAPNVAGKPASHTAPSQAPAEELLQPVVRPAGVPLSDLDAAANGDFQSRLASTSQPAAAQGQVVNPKLTPQTDIQGGSQPASAEIDAGDAEALPQKVFAGMNANEGGNAAKPAGADGPTQVPGQTSGQASGQAAGQGVLPAAAAIAAAQQVAGEQVEGAEPDFLQNFDIRAMSRTDPAFTGRVEGAQTPAQAQSAQVATQVVGEIARHLQNGQTRFQMRFDPPELGRVDVNMRVASDGSVQAHLIVERPETLDMFLRDQRGLERALEAAGLSANADDLQFSLKDEGGREFAFGEGGDQSQGENGTGGEEVDEQVDTATLDQATRLYQVTGSSGLDIRI